MSEHDEVVAEPAAPEVVSVDDANIVEPQEAVVEDSTVTIRMSKRAARIGALVLAGFLGFLIGVVGAGVVHHIHDGRDGRGPGNMRFDDESRMGPNQFGPGQFGSGQFGPGQGMMPGGPNGQGFGPDDRDGHGMMPGGPNGQGGMPTPVATAK